jgi:alkanesulfonate monooxygenase SsuD/methylene tetrahydromethanopterin reductase-like flavin-dependent oxidoreductase (luciferase family)
MAAARTLAGVRFGVVLPIGSGSVADAARRIEAAGFDSAWVVDAHNRGLLLQDPFVALAVAASHTTRLEVGSCVIQAPLRHPFDLAERALTVHLVAEGRFLFGVGSGSTAQDYAAFGLDFGERFRLLDGHIRTARRLWAGEDVDGASLPPWPGQLGGPPLLIGAFANGRWIQRAATEFDGWIGSVRSTDLATLRQGLARFRDAGGQRAVAANLAASRADAADVLHQLDDAGFDDAVVIVERHDDDELARVRALLAP